MQKLHRVFTKCFTIFFFSNVVKTKNLRGIRILKMLEDHLLEIFVCNIYIVTTSVSDFKHLYIFYNFHLIKQIGLEQFYI